MDNKIHRADIFIDGTVIEFQHSPIKEVEFNDRNDFYLKLGYKIIWIFDALDRDIHLSQHNINDDVYCEWNYPIKFLNNVDYANSNLSIYLQIGKAIWYRQPDYKNIEDIKKVAIEKNIIKIDKVINGIKSFLSNDYYSDFEIINNYVKINNNSYIHFPYKKIRNLHNLTDAVSNSDLENYFDFYGYCPLRDKEFFYHKKCQECCYLDSVCMRCMYRFKNLKKDRVSEILNVDYDQDGRVIYAILRFDNEIEPYSLEELPTYTKTILAFADKFYRAKWVRFIDVKTGNVIYMSGFNLRMLLKNKKCIGRLCYYNWEGKYKATREEREIYYWNEPRWLLIWYVFD